MRRVELDIAFKNLLLSCFFLLASDFYCAQADVTLLPTVQGYGFIIPTIVGASAGVDSFSQNNASAFTSAAHPLLATSPDQGALTFQVAQSRFGIVVGASPKVRGRLELDFIDFTKSSPMMTAVPRLRRATVEYTLNETDLLTLGQEYDLFSYLVPHTYNFVGHYYQAGDSGFMRQQLIWLRNTGSTEYGAALGLQTSNATPSMNNLELSLRPTLALRWASLGAQSKWGISSIATQILVDRVANQYRSAWGLNAFAELKTSDSAFNLRAEAYGGRNLANLSMLSLSFGNSVADVSEVGGWLTGRWGISSQTGVFGGVGYAQVLNPQQMLASYSVTSNGSSNSYQLSGTGPGIERNGTLRLGMDYKPEPNLTWFLEYAYLTTYFHLLGGDSIVEPIRFASVGQAGMMYSF